MYTSVALSLYIATVLYTSDTRNEEYNTSIYHVYLTCRTPQPAAADITRRSVDSPPAPLRRSVTMPADASRHRSRLSPIAVAPTISHQAATVAQPAATGRQSAVGAAWPAQVRNKLPEYYALIQVI